MPIRVYLKHNDAFDPEAIAAMSEALEQACTQLHVKGHAYDREIIATRIIDLARNGAIDAKALGERVIGEAEAMRSFEGEAPATRR
jgi:hypothetical protein